MTMADIGLESIDLTLLDHTPDLCCDNADSEWCAKEEVRWRTRVQCPACRRSKWELWCDPCRNLVIVTEDGFECAQCGELVFPARRMIDRFEPLEGK